MSTEVRQKLTVVGLAGMELTFFIAARVALCFASVAKTALITHCCVGYC